MNKCIYVGTLKYSPVYKSHCCAFGTACEASGYYVKYLFNHEYKWMLSSEVKKKTVFIGQSTDVSSMVKDTLNLKNLQLIRKIFLEDSPTHFYVHNYHLLNHYIAKLAEKYDCKFIYHVHEPYTIDKKAHGGIQQYWLHLYEFFDGILIDKTDTVVLSSKTAQYLFDLRYHNFSGKKMLIPLMYEDLCNFDFNLQDRRYITFIGPPVPAKNPEKFLEIVRYSNMIGLGLKFLLVSRKRVNDPRFYNEANLEIFHKEKISDEEFGEIIKKSLAIIAPYRRETQSSVLLTSYMYGTPVVSSDVGGLPEFVHHKKTGYIVDLYAKLEEWIEGINYILQNFPIMSRNCRKYFEENFSGKNWNKYLDELLN